MYIENLHLCVTRNCTLECEHCLRGDRENVNMNPQILDRIFEDVKKVEFLLLTGGEPLLAIETIEKLIEILKTRKVRVNKLTIISNGTVLNERILKALEELSKYTYFIFMISKDIFHELELERLDLEETRRKNLAILRNRKILWHFDEDYGKENDGRWKASIEGTGRAAKLTPERLAEINAMSTQEYVILGPFEPRHPKTTMENNKVIGNITVNSYGFLVSYGSSFEEEDEESYETAINVMDMPFKKAVKAFIDIKNPNQELKQSSPDEQILKKTS